MQSDNLPDREQIVNNVKAYAGAQVVRDLVDFYKTPLVKAVTLLNKKYQMSYQQIADEVFDGQIRRQAVEQNYTNGGSK